jgi:[ribosomal protein S5]-alanine N-acetyltransferase
MTRLSDLLPAACATTRLRLFLAGDTAAFHAYRSDPELARFQGWSTMTEREARGFVEEMSTVAQLRPGDWIQLAVADVVSNRLIGDVGLFLAADGREAELGFTLSRPAQGQGHASAAARLATRLVFECAPAERVRGVTDARNAASIRVLERAGFEKVGEQQAQFKGEDCVEFVFAICRRPEGLASQPRVTVEPGAACALGAEIETPSGVRRLQ